MFGKRFRCWPRVWFAALGFVGVVSCPLEPPPEARLRDPLTATRGALVIRHILSGTLVAAQAADLMAPDVGIFPLQLRWLAEHGSFVRAGDRIVELDNSSLVQKLEDLERQVDQAETGLETTISTAVAAVAEAQFNLLQKRTALDRARIEADIPKDLRAELEYAKLQLELRKAELELADAHSKEAASRKTGEGEIEIARISLERSRRELEAVRVKVGRLELLAPSDGVVVLGRNWREDRTFESGDTVNPGLAIARLPNLDTLYVRAELFDVDDGAIEPGLSALVELEAVPQLQLRGTVQEISAIAKQTSRRSLRRVFRVSIALDDTRGAPLLPGMSARVIVERRVEVGRDGELPILVPRTALDLSTSSSNEVFLASGERRQVELGACSNTHCIVEEGIDVGTLLATVRREADG